jgi:hypothetical protein
MRQEIETERAAVDALARELRQREEDVIARIEAGVPVDGQAVVRYRPRSKVPSIERSMMAG